MNTKYVIPAVFIIVAAVILGASGYLYYQYYGSPRCEACGMIITPEMEANIYMLDTNTNQRVWTCCAGCMLRSVAAHHDVHIEIMDSWYGSSAPDTVIEIRNSSVLSITPDTGRLLLGAKIVKGCANNRFAINDTSAQLLIQNGYNAANPLTVFKNPLPNGTPIVAVSAALPGMITTGIAYVPPSNLFLVAMIVVGVAVLLLSIVAWKKLIKPATPKPQTGST
jgi:hypothetical protein